MTERDRQPQPGAHVVLGAVSADARPPLPSWPAGTVNVLCTVDEDGVPHAIPVSTARPTSRREVVLALAPGRGSLARLRARPSVALAVLAGGDLAFTVRGHARVVAEQLPGAEGVAAVAIDVDTVDDHDLPTFAIEAGVGWRWTDPDAEERDRTTRDALERLGRRSPG